MSRQLTPLIEIDQKIQRRWTVLVQVLECHHVLQTKNGSYYKRLMLTDVEGLKFTALIFTESLDHYARTFTQYKRYRISNAFVIANDPRYAISSYGFSWVLNKRTLVEEYPEHNLLNLPCTFQFTDFTKLHEHAESNRLQNVRGIVLRCLPSHEQGGALVTRRDILIINEEKLPLVITLWNQFDEHEGSMLQAMKGPPALIFGLRLKVTTFNSLSLTTRPNSSFLINPPVAEELQLRTWYNNNRDEIHELLSTTNYRKNDYLLPYPPDGNVVSIFTATSHFESIKTAWIKGTLTLPAQERQLSYTACVNCLKSLEADTTWIVTCPSCHVESEVQEMSRLTILITDESGILKANLNTPEVEKFIPFSAKDVKVCEENGQSLCDAIAAAIESIYIVAFIRAYEVHFRGTTDIKVNIVKAYKVTANDFVNTESEDMRLTSHTSGNTSTTKTNSYLPPKTAHLCHWHKKRKTRSMLIMQRLLLSYTLLPQNKPSPSQTKKQIVPDASTLLSAAEQASDASEAIFPVKEDNRLDVNNPRPTKKTK